MVASKLLSNSYETLSIKAHSAWRALFLFTQLPSAGVLGETQALHIGDHHYKRGVALYPTPQALKGDPQDVPGYQTTAATTDGGMLLARHGASSPLDLEHRPAAVLGLRTL